MAQSLISEMAAKRLPKGFKRAERQQVVGPTQPHLSRKAKGTFLLGGKEGITQSFVYPP